jgi:hypothetical protein
VLCSWAHFMDRRGQTVIDKCSGIIELLDVLAVPQNRRFGRSDRARHDDWIAFQPDPNDGRYNAQSCPCGL